MCVSILEHMCVRVSQCACVCILVCMREGWGIWPPICARLFRYCFCRHTHTDTVTHTYTHTHCGALCQASCSLAGAGNAPERVVASICSTGEWLGCVWVYACVCVCVCVATEKQNNGTVLMMLLVVSVVGVGTEFRDVLVEKLRLFDGHGGWMWRG